MNCFAVSQQVCHSQIVGSSHYPIEGCDKKMLLANINNSLVTSTMLFTTINWRREGADKLNHTSFKILHGERPRSRIHASVSSAIILAPEKSANMMILKLGSKEAAILLLLVHPSQSQQTCTGVRTHFPAPSEGSCLPWSNQRLQDKTYPGDFDGIFSIAEIYQCPSSGKRVIISNGIPNHDLTLQNDVGPCEINWAVEVSQRRLFCS